MMNELINSNPHFEGPTLKRRIKAVA